MIRVVLFFIAIGLLAAGTAWLADRPGDLVLNWLGYRIEVSVMTAAAVLLVLIGILVFLWSLLASIIASPGMLTGLLRARRRQKGMVALSQGIIAVGAGDAKGAAKFSAQANKIIGDQPLALLLRAQTAQLRGDKAGARRAFEAMLKSPDTQSLGLRGLYVEAQRQGDREAAMAFAKRALEDDASTGWAATALFDMQCAAGAWDQALATLATNLRHKLIDKPTAQRWRAVLLTGQAMRAEDTDPDLALQMAQEANKLAANLVPAAVIAGRIYGQQDNTRKAMRILEQTWQSAPHPDIAEAYGNVRPGDSVRDRLQRVKTLAAKTPGNAVGAVAVAEAAIDALDWKTAREALAVHVENTLERPSQRICALMAEIEEGEQGDHGRAREWLSRAVHAPRDPAWTADGIVSPIWAPISPATGRIDAFEWKVPIERIGGYDSKAEEETLIAPASVDEPETLEITTEPAKEPEDQATETPSEIGSPTPIMNEGDVRELLNDAKPDAIPRAPDDPGPGAADIIDEDKSLKSP